MNKVLTEHDWMKTFEDRGSVPYWYQLLPSAFSIDYPVDGSYVNFYSTSEMKKYFDKILTEILEYIDNEVNRELNDISCLENESEIQKSQFKIKILNDIMCDIGNEFYDYSDCKGDI